MFKDYCCTKYLYSDGQILESCGKDCPLYLVEYDSSTDCPYWIPRDRAERMLDDRDRKYFA